MEKIGTRVYEVETQDGQKYSFWETKKNNTLTKACEQYQKFRFIAGDHVEIAFKETPTSYQNSKTGETIHKTNKGIVYFKTEEGGNAPTAPVRPVERPIPVVQPIKPDNTAQRLEAIEKDIKNIKEFVGFPSDYVTDPTVDEELEEVPF